jgi:hypothetical protein
VEFWIGSKDSEPPVLSPKYQPTEGFDCPNIELNVSRELGSVTIPVRFDVRVDPEATKATTSRWTLSSGEIIDGQGTSSINVDPKGRRRLTVLAELGGLPLPCKNVAYKTVDLDEPAPTRQRISACRSFDLNMAIDNFMISLDNHPDALGYVIVYESRNSVTKNEAIAKVKRFFVRRHYFEKRVRLLPGGFREDETVDLWMLPRNAETPPFSPTVDPSFIRTMRLASPRRPHKCRDIGYDHSRTVSM